MRLEQIGLELSLDNDQALSTNAVAAAAGKTSLHQQRHPIHPSTLDIPLNLTSNTITTTTTTSITPGTLRITNTLTTSTKTTTSTASTASSGSPTTATTTTTTTSPPSSLSLPSRRDSDRGGTGGGGRISVTTPKSLITGSGGNQSINPISPGTMSTRISSEFKKNMFFIEPDQEPITTTLPPEEIFEELDILGTGSGGKVLKMRHIPSGKICAVKQMRRTFNDEENKRIYMDLQVVLQCECDNIVRCCGYFIKETEVWICMELMTTCFDKLLKARKKSLPEKFLGAIAASAIKALYYLKEKHNIIHRDVKPSNILINDQGQIKLCDFGISGRLIDSLAKTRAAGCVPYMAPERIDSTSYPSYDIRADVWSLGITLHELATGRSPYAECSTDFNILVKVVNDDPPKLPEDMEFTPEFRNFISSCLTKDCKHRPKYKQLIEHEFIKKHLETVVYLNELD